MKKLATLIVFALLAISMISFVIAESNESDNETTLGLSIFGNETADENETAGNESLIVGEENESLVAPVKNMTITIVGTKKLPTPGTVYCEKKGYNSIVRTDSTGKEYRVCAFPDGKECHELEFLLGKCGKEYRNMTKEEIIKMMVKKLNEQIKERYCKDGCSLNIENKNITIRDLTDEKREIIAEKISAKTGLDLTAEEVDEKIVLKAYLSNGRWALIKYMPDKASEKAIDNLKVKCEERNCTIELKEVGIGNESKLAYELSTDKDVSVLLIFKKKMPVMAQVDAETGKIISINKKPWWAFLAKENDEE
jgi:putative hemolysin